MFRKKKYGEYDAVFCIYGNEGAKYKISVCLRCKYTIVVAGTKRATVPVGQYLYQDFDGVLDTSSAPAKVEIGSAASAEQPWKGTWKLGKGEMSLKTTKGADVVFHVHEFFQSPPFVWDKVMAEPSSSTHIASDILGWKDNKAIGNYGGVINFRELPKYDEKTGECSEFDGRLAGKVSGAAHDFHIAGRVTKAGALIIDKKHPDIGAWHGMVYPDGRIRMYNSGRNHMTYKVPKKSVWGPIFKAGKERWYCLAKAERCDEKKKPYGEYDGVIVLDNPKGDTWDITLSVHATYKIKVTDCEVGQCLYKHATGKLTVKGAIGNIEIGNDQHMGQPWKGTWKVGTKEKMDLKTTYGGEVIFHLSDFFNTAPAHEHNVQDAMG